MKRIYFIISLLALSIISFAQITTQPLSSAFDTALGLIYSLPKTVITVEVETRRIQETPGIYFPYAERYLGFTNICQTEKVHYEITGVRISTKAIPDLQNTFVIGTGKEKKAPSIELTSEGFLKSINRNSDCKKGSKEIVKMEVKPSADDYQTKETSIFTQEMQQSNSTAKMAELAAAQIFNLRESRINLLTSDIDKTPSDGRSYEIVLGELNRMENYCMELFTGKHKESTETTIFEYDPQKNGEEILFRFSELKGIVDKTNLGGSPVFINIQKAVGTRADLIKTVHASAKKGVSLYYRMPGKAQIKIKDGTSVLCDQEISVAQFGRVLTLPAGAVKSAEICPKTGAIMRLGE